MGDQGFRSLRLPNSAPLRRAPNDRPQIGLEVETHDTKVVAADRGRWRRLIAEGRGASDLEYLILAGVIAILGIGAWRAFGTTIKCAALGGSQVVRDLDLPNHSVLSCLDETGPAETQGRPGRRSERQGPTYWGCRGSTKPAPGSSPPTVTVLPSPPPAPPPTRADLVIKDVLAVMCPQDKAFLVELKNRHVTVSVYDRIYFDDKYHDGKQWTVQRVEVAGTTPSATGVHIKRGATAEETAATLYHEAVHTKENPNRPWRDREYDAYFAEDQWRIAHNIDPMDPSFRKRDASGQPVIDPVTKKQVTNPDGIRAHVGGYPGVSVTPPGGKGPPEQIIDFLPNGKVLVERQNGSTYQRFPKKNDAYSGSEMDEPAVGTNIDMAKMQCP